jgi:hypothetical protein
MFCVVQFTIYGIFEMQRFIPHGLRRNSHPGNWRRPQFLRQMEDSLNFLYGKGMNLFFWQLETTSTALFLGKLRYAQFHFNQR